MAKQDQLRVAVVTGASSGIGKAAAKALAAQGWRVIGLGRDPERCAAAEAEIRAQAAPGARMEMIRGDLSLMADTVRIANEIAARTDRVDVLLNNAGGMAKALVLTAEGNEELFASNHLGHFLLTNRLLPLLRAAAKSSAPGSVRVINVSSDAHEYANGLDWDDLQLLANYDGGRAYCRAKLLNILFTRALAKRLAGDGIVTHSMHPGIVNSNFINHADERSQNTIRQQQERWISPEAGADTLIWLATATEPGQTSGEYFYQRKAIAPSAAALDDTSADRLWDASEKLVAQALAKR